MDLAYILFRLGCDVLLLQHSTLPYDISFGLGEQRSLRVRHVFAAVVFYFEHEIDLFKRQSFRLDVKEPDNRSPGEIQDGEDDVEFPGNVGNSWFACQQIPVSQWTAYDSRRTTWCHDDHDVNKQPVRDHGDTVAHASHARGVNLRWVQERDAKV